MSDYEIAAEQRREIIRQIGAGNLMAISGGRTVPIKGGVSLPVSAGYHVHVELEPNDTYTVTRWFARCGKFHQHGQVANVYADQVGQMAYRASCHRSARGYSRLQAGGESRPPLRVAYRFLSALNDTVSAT